MTHIEKTGGGLRAELSRASERLNAVCWWFAVAFTAAMLGCVLIQVVARYVFFSPPSWTEEAARYCMIWAGLLGATVSYRRKADPVLFPERRTRSSFVNAALRLARASAALIFVLPVLIYAPGFVVRHMSRLTESLEFISGYVVIVVPLFAGIILFHTLADLFGTGNDKDGTGQQ